MAIVLWRQNFKLKDDRSTSKFGPKYIYKLTIIMMHANIIECFETINISTNQKIDGVINVIFYLMSKVVGYLPPNITPYFIYKLATNITKHVLHQNVLH